MQSTAKGEKSTDIDCRQPVNVRDEITEIEPTIETEVNEETVRTRLVDNREYMVRCSTRVRKLQSYLKEFKLH